MRSALLAALLLALPCTAAAQSSWAWSFGMTSPGQLVRERTHYVRLSGNGADVHLGVMGDAMLTPHWGVAARAHLLPTILYRWPVEERDIDSRWSHRPGASAEAWPVIWTHAAIGARWRATSWFDAAAGLSLTCLSAISYHRVGASPMCRGGGWLESRASVAIAPGARLALTIGATPMPGGNCSSWTALYEMTSKDPTPPSPEHDPVTGQCINPRTAVWPVYAELQFEVRGR